MKIRTSDGGSEYQATQVKKVRQVRKKRMAFTNEENLKILQMISEGYDTQKLMKNFPNRGISSIVARIKLLTSKRENLQSEEIPFAAENFYQNDTTDRVRLRWRVEDDQHLLKLRREGVTKEQIAQILGRSTHAIQARVHKLENQVEQRTQSQKQAVPVVNKEVGAKFQVQANNNNMQQADQELRNFIEKQSSEDFQLKQLQAQQRLEDPVKFIQAIVKSQKTDGVTDQSTNESSKQTGVTQQNQPQLEYPNKKNQPQLEYPKQDDQPQLEYQKQAKMTNFLTQALQGAKKNIFAQQNLQPNPPIAEQNNAKENCNMDLAIERTFSENEEGPPQNQIVQGNQNQNVKQEYAQLDEAQFYSEYKKFILQCHQERKHKLVMINEIARTMGAEFMGMSSKKIAFLVYQKYKKFVGDAEIKAVQKRLREKFNSMMMQTQRISSSVHDDFI